MIGNLVEVRLKKPDDFLKIKETLTRIGVASRKDKTLYQSCHILHKKGLYYIVHFKELLQLDGKETNYDSSDKGRRNTIASLLDDWGLFEIVNPDIVENPKVPINQIKIITYKEKDEWTLVPKYNIGVHKSGNRLDNGAS